MSAKREPEQPAEDDHVLIAIIVLLLAGLTLEEFTRRLALLLAAAGIPAEAAITAVRLLGVPGLRFESLPGGDSAVDAMQRSGISRRAMFLLASARRIGQGSSVAAERALYQAHLRAEDRRHGAAQRISAAAARFGPMLGWKSRLDDRTTPECRQAHGSNFSALKPPVIGWPGTLHAGNCRCQPAEPWAQGIVLP